MAEMVLGLSRERFEAIRRAEAEREEREKANPEAMWARIEREEAEERAWKRERRA